MMTAIRRRFPPNHHRPALVGLRVALLVALAHGTYPELRAAGAPSSTNLPLLQYGKLEVRPHWSYTGSYHDGLSVRPGFARNSYIDAFAPGFLLKFGDRWSVDYTPTLTMYSNPAFRDTLGHALSATGGIPFGRSNIDLRQGYSYSSAPLVETGRQTDTEVAATTLTASHVLGPKLVLQGGFEQTLTFVAASPDFHQWAVFGGLQTNLSSRVSAMLSVRSGYAAIYKSADMVYVQPGGEITWRPTQKLSFTAGISLDERVYLLRTWRWRESPMYSGSFAFEPFATTKVQAQVRRTIAPSFFDGQTSDGTLWSLSGEQRFLGHFWLSGGLDYTNSSYLTIGRTDAIRRKDNIWTYKAALRTTFRKRGAISVSYQDSDNSSNIPGFALESSQIACEVSYRY